MFKLFKRVKTVVNSELHHLIDKAEDPIKMVDQFLREMEKDLRDVEIAATKVIAEEKLLQKKVEEAEELVDTREQQAMVTLRVGNENLARRALEDKARIEEDIQELKALHENTANSAAELKDHFKQMKAEYQEMERKKSTLITRATTAQAKTKVNRTLSSINGEGSQKGFDRMEKKVLQFEAEAETSVDFRESNQSLDSELNELKLKNRIDEEIEVLRQKVKQNKNTTHLEG